MMHRRAPCKGVEFELLAAQMGDLLGCRPGQWHSAAACCLCRPEDVPSGTPTVSMWGSPSLERLSRADAGSVQPAPYPHLRVLTWHMRVRGHHKIRPNDAAMRILKIACHVCLSVMSDEAHMNTMQ